MLTLQAYWMGRDKQYPNDLSTSVRANAERLVDIVNKLIPLAQKAGVDFDIDPKTKTIVASGWRPPAVNAGVANAAPRSKHMTGEAVDIYDPDGELDTWLMTKAGQQALKDLGLWMEHPAATKTWCHLQTRPPKSGNRVFYP